MTMIVILVNTPVNWNSNTLKPLFLYLLEALFVYLGQLRKRNTQIKNLSQGTEGINQLHLVETTIQVSTYSEVVGLSHGRLRWTEL